MVESYETLYAQAVEQGGSNFKTPFNQIGNTASVFTPTPRSSRRIRTRGIRLAGSGGPYWSRSNCSIFLASLERIFDVRILRLRSQSLTFFCLIYVSLDPRIQTWVLRFSIPSRTSTIPPSKVIKNPQRL